MAWARKVSMAIFMILILLSLIVITVPVRSEGAYRVPITITERSGNNLYNYTIKIKLNSTNFNGWVHILSDNGSDIYFIDTAGKPLYYWIEYFNKTEQKAIIRVKMPYINANSTTTIYMYYGGDNPYSSYNNQSKVFIFYDDFNDLSKWEQVSVTDSSKINVYTSNGLLVAHFDIPTGLNKGFVNIWKTLMNFTLPIIVEVKMRADWSADEFQFKIKMYGQTNDEAYIRCDWSDDNIKWYHGDNEYVADSALDDGQWHLIYFGMYDSKHEGYEDGILKVSVTATLPSSAPIYMIFGGYSGGGGGWGDIYIDWLRIRKYVDPEPSVSIGSSEAVVGLVLPSRSLFLGHYIVYSPNSTQFIHSFSTANASTAEYEVNYTTSYGWRVYADPYEVNGTCYENNASLVSEVNITLPYSEVLVENVTLSARTNGTGNFRQLWVKVLDSAGGVVAELINATMGTDWTEVSLVVNTSLGGQITIWINATVKSTTIAGEEIAVKDVRVYVEYETNPQVSVEFLPPNVEFFNCSVSHYVELGSSEYLNSSVIVFKLIQYLTYDTTDYPVQPSYVGGETIGSYNYSVYKVAPANHSQYMTIYALLENRFKTFRTHVKGYDTETILIGEPLSIELPELGNITIVELNRSFINVTSVTISFPSAGSYTIEAKLTQPTLWKLGYGVRRVTVKYGVFSVKPIDIDSKTVDYEDLVLQLINKTDGSVVKEVVGNQLFSLDSLWAGNYSIVVRFKDIVIGTRDFELNITTDASAIDILCTMRILKDYRGLNRSIVYEHDKQLMDVESLSTKYPYSRTRILLNGTGSFKLYVNYRGDLPTEVRVVGNATNLQYYWNGNYLVITGTLGSVGEINVTDLYKLRVEMYDRLGNLMPSWIYAYVNETKYSGAIVEDCYYPEDYVIKLPATINGFKFFSFFDGFNESVRAISINNSDITLKAWYRVPTSVKEVKSYQVASLWWLPFIKQDSDRVKVYIEGYLIDYYGYGVPNRPVTINITDVDAGFTWTINVTTDATGYFRTPILELVRGRIYRIDVDYRGDDIYVGSYSTMEIKPEELPTAPIAPEIPIEYYIMAVAAALIIIGIAVAAIRAVRHTVEDLRARTRKFVKKK